MSGAGGSSIAQSVGEQDLSDPTAPITGGLVSSSSGEASAVTNLVCQAVADMSESASAQYYLNVPGAGTSKSVPGIEAEFLYTMAESEAVALLNCFAVSGPYTEADPDASSRIPPTIAIDGSGAFVDLIAHALEVARTSTTNTVNQQLTQWFQGELGDDNIQDEFSGDHDVSGFRIAGAYPVINLDVGSGAVAIDAANGANALLSKLAGDATYLQDVFGEIDGRALGLYSSVTTAGLPVLDVNALPLKGNDTITFVFKTTKPNTTTFTSYNMADGSDYNDIYTTVSGNAAVGTTNEHGHVSAAGDYTPASRTIALTITLKNAAGDNGVFTLRAAADAAPVAESSLPAGIPTGLLA